VHETGFQAKSLNKKGLPQAGGTLDRWQVLENGGKLASAAEVSPTCHKVLFKRFGGLGIPPATR
jgi:hypothetical protein